MIFEEFSPAAIACAIGWMAAGADRQLRGDYFARWATALLVDDNPTKFTFEQLTDFENGVRRRDRRGISQPHVLRSGAATSRQAWRTWRPTWPNSSRTMNTYEPGTPRSQPTPQPWPVSIAGTIA